MSVSQKENELCRWRFISTKVQNAESYKMEDKEITFSDLKPKSKTSLFESVRCPYEIATKPIS